MVLLQVDDGRAAVQIGDDGVATGWGSAQRGNIVIIVCLVNQQHCSHFSSEGNILNKLSDIYFGRLGKASTGCEASLTQGGKSPDRLVETQGQWWQTDGKSPS